jgi:hypothetical protein
LSMVRVASEVEMERERSAHLDSYQERFGQDCAAYHTIPNSARYLYAFCGVNENRWTDGRSSGNLESPEGRPARLTPIVRPHPGAICFSMVRVTVEGPKSLRRMTLHQLGMHSGNFAVPESLKISLRFEVPVTE